MSEFDADLMNDFVEEADGHLTHADELLKKLESAPDDESALLELYRAFHSIKGVAAFLELEDIEGLAKDAEALMTCARKGAVSFAGEVKNSIVRARFLLGKLIKGVEKSIPQGQMPPRDSSVEAIRGQLASLMA